MEQILDESCVPRKRAQQRTAKHIDVAPQFLEEVFEMERLAPHDQELQLTAMQMAEILRERYGDRDACLSALHELKARLAARCAVMC